MAKKILTAAVIGAGKMGTYHALIYQKLTNVRLNALAVASKRSASVKKEVFGIPIYTSYKKLLKEIKPDLVSIAVPSAMHADVAIDCLNAGCNVLLEKPIAVSTQQAQEIIQVAQTSGKKLMVGHIERFNPVIVQAKKQLKLDQIGRILLIEAVRAGSMPNNPTTDVLMDLGIHDLDLFSYFTGDVLVKAAGYKRKFKGVYHDWFSICGESTKGIIFNYQTNWLSPLPQRRISIVGETGRMSLDLLTKKLSIINKNNKDLIQTNTYRKGNPLVNEIKSFIKSILTNDPVAVSGQDGLSALSQYEMVLKSSRNF